MNRRSKLWLAVASLFNIINAGGGGFAAAQNEGAHAAVHVALLLVGSIWAWRIATRPHLSDSLGAATQERMERLQESVDAMAIELERMGEAQRFMAKLEQERAQKVPLKPDR